MTREEKKDYITIPLLMFGMCLSFMLFGILAITVANQHELAYMLWGVGAFLFVFVFSEWWPALKAWRNGETRRTDLEEDKN